MNLANRIPALVSGPIAAAVVAAALAGCATSEPVPRRQSGIIVGTQGAASEVVFAGVQVAAAGPLVPGPEYARRDASLGVHGPITAFELDAWPRAPRPSLSRARYLYAPRSPNEYIYFGQAYQFQYVQPACPYDP